MGLKEWDSERRSRCSRSSCHWLILECMCCVCAGVCACVCDGSTSVPLITKRHVLSTHPSSISSRTPPNHTLVRVKSLKKPPMPLVKIVSPLILKALDAGAYIIIISQCLYVYVYVCVWGEGGYCLQLHVYTSGRIDAN